MTIPRLLAGLRHAAGTLLLLPLLSAQAASLDGLAVQIDQRSGFGFGGAFSDCFAQSTAAVVGAGVEQVGVAGSGDGCVGFFDVDLDPVAGTLVLTGRENGNYEVGRLSISGLGAYGVGGVTLVSSNLIDPNAYGGDHTAVPSPSIQFSSDMVSIEYSAEGLGDGQFSYGNGDAFTAVFQISQVPEPAAAAMLLLGLGGLGLLARRRAASGAAA